MGYLGKRSRCQREVFREKTCEIILAWRASWPKDRGWDKIQLSGASTRTQRKALWRFETNLDTGAQHACTEPSDVVESGSQSHPVDALGQQLCTQGAGGDGQRLSGDEEPRSKREGSIVTQYDRVEVTLSKPAASGGWARCCFGYLSG